jgi:predicted kinase
VTGPPASGKTTLARPLAGALGLPLLSKDTIKEALYDTLGVGDRDWSRRLGAGSYAVLLAVARELGSAAVLDANFYPDHGPDLLSACARPIEVFCRCPAAEVARRFIERSPTRHPGHVDHTLDRARLDAMAAMQPLALGGPVLALDTSSPVDVDAVAAWVRVQLAVPVPAENPVQVETPAAST